MNVNGWHWNRGFVGFALADVLMVAIAWMLAFWLRFNFEMPEEYLRMALATLPWAVGCMAVGLALARVQRQAWRYVSLADVRQLAWGVLLGVLLTVASVMVLRYPGFARSVFPIFGLLVLALLTGARATWRSLAEQRINARREPGQAPVIIVGTLEEADQAMRTIKGSPGWYVVGIVSPREQDVGQSLQNVSVLGTTQHLGDIAQSHQVRSVLLASPPGTPLRREMLLRWSGTALNLLSMPTAEHWLNQSATDLRRVELEDLLGRTPVQLNAGDLAEWLSGQSVMITGAGGSIGAELCRQVSRFGVAHLVCVDVSEAAIYTLEQELRSAHPEMQGHYFTANVREYDRIKAIAERFKPIVIFHAAAYKHVPLMEESNEVEALRTNVLGTLNVARVAGECGARRCVLVSTDKAVNPTSIMGASKRLAERVVQAMAKSYPSTEYVAVRFGNVLGSSGSVVPLFTSQIARGGPITVTHPEIVRYFMTIPEAAQLVVQAGRLGQSGQIYVLDMGEPVKIVELARLLIRLSGRTEAEIPIAYTGLRPGEKLFEEWLANDETTTATSHPQLRVVRQGEGTPDALDIVTLSHWIEALGPEPAPHHLRNGLHGFVPEYRSRGG